MKKFITYISILIIVVCSVVVVNQLLSTLKRRYNNLNTPDNNKSANISNTLKNNEIAALNTLAPSSSTYYSDTEKNSGTATANSSEIYDTDNNSNIKKSYSYNNSDAPKIQNTMPPVSDTINASSQQILDAVSTFIREAGIFNNIKMKLIDQNVAESRGTFTNDIDSLIKKYPGFAGYKTYLKLVAGQDVYARAKVVVDENNQLIPSFESLYIGILPIPTSLINNKLKDDGEKFTDALKSQLN